MSYDLQIWSTAAVNVAEVLPESEKWQRSGDIWTRTGKGWQLSVGRCDQVSPEDIPEEVERVLPGIAFLTEMNLSPITAAASARKQMSRLASVLAKAARGVVVDPQTDTITTAKGVSRVEPLGSSETAAVVALSWWFASAPLVERDIAPLISALESSLPEALPRRYGLYEPPQYKYEAGGREHFQSFFRESSGPLGFVVWYPHAPIADVSLSVPPQVGGSRMGFRCGTLRIEVDEEALAQPGWAVSVQRAWRSISRVIKPFYGDVRRLGGFARRRRRYWSGPQTEHHPVCSWWWAGIPVGRVRAAVLGNPYRTLWPAFCERAESNDELSFVSNTDWRTDADALEKLGPPPADIAQQAPEHGSPNSQRRYPETWPFGPPRIDE